MNLQAAINEIRPWLGTGALDAPIDDAVSTLIAFVQRHKDLDDDVDVAAKEAAYDLDAELELPPVKGMFPDIPSYIAGFKKGADWEKCKLLNTIIK